MRTKHQAAIPNHSVVILSEAKDLWFCSGFQNEVQRCFASLNMPAWMAAPCRVSSFSDIRNWKMVIKI